MISVQQAARTAIQYCADLFGEISGVRLEEVELTDDDKHWLITVGFDEPRPSQTMQAYGMIQGFAPSDPQRQYRVVNVNAATGEVRSVKIRQPLERIS